MFVRQKSHKMKNNQPLWILGHKIQLHETTGDYDLAQFVTPAKSQGPPPHSHHKYEESFLIVEGEMEFMVNGETKTYTYGGRIHRHSSGNFAHLFQHIRQTL
jgi:mannose-6-phosphate isomerase-like protein (cupin superfamily)